MADERDAERQTENGDRILHSRRVLSGKKLQLLETLLALATQEELDLAGYGESEYVRGALLIVSSNSPEACDAIDRLAYDTYEIADPLSPHEIRGLVLPGPQLTLRELVEALLSAKKLPGELAEAEPDLTLEDYRAGLLAIQCILYSLEGSSFDGRPAHEKRYSQELRKRRIAAVLRSLESYRSTGEP